MPSAANWDFPDGTRFDDTQVPGQVIEVQQGKPVIVGSDQFVKSKSAADDDTMKTITDQQAAAEALNMHAQRFMAADRNPDGPLLGSSPFMHASDDSPTAGHGMGDALAQPFRALGHAVGTVANPVNWDPKLNEMAAEAVPMATSMRAPGMRLTQQEIKWFGGAVPSVSRTVQANEPVAKNIAAANTFFTAKHAFYTSWRAQHGNLDGVDAPWQGFVASRFDPQGNYLGPPKARTPAAAAPAAAPAVKSGIAPGGGAWSAVPEDPSQ